MKLSIVEGTVLGLVLAALCGGVAFYLDHLKLEPAEIVVMEVAEPLEEDPFFSDEGRLIPLTPLGESLRVPDAVEPHLTWRDVREALSYLSLTDKLGAGTKEVMAVGNKRILIVSNSKLSASTFYRRWVRAIKREGLPLKNVELWVTVTGRNSSVEKTHHCTTSGAH